MAQNDCAAVPVGAEILVVITALVVVVTEHNPL